MCQMKYEILGTYYLRKRVYLYSEKEILFSKSRVGVLHERRGCMKGTVNFNTICYTFRHRKCIAHIYWPDISLAPPIFCRWHQAFRAISYQTSLMQFVLLLVSRDVN